MPAIELREVDIYGTPALRDRVAALVSSELGGNRTGESILQTINFQSGGTKVFGGFIGENLVSMNAFMKTTFHGVGGDVVGYQSGFSATDSAHRGNGYWPMLLSFAENYLAQTGAAFIYGFPNPISHPLFVKKLRYVTLDLYNLRIACFPGVYDRAFKSADTTTQSLEPDFDELVQWKSHAQRGHFINVEDNGSRLWGKMRSIKKFAFPVHYLEIGSLQIESRGNLKSLLKRAARLAGVRLLYISMNPGSSYFPLLNFKQYGQPIIVKSLGRFETSQSLTFFGGMRDTF